MEKLHYLCQYANCESPKEGNTDYCASHNKSFRRLAKDLSRVPKERKPIKKVSNEKKLVNDEYSVLRKDYLNHQSICEIKLSGCTRKATTIHHASTSANDFLNADTWFSACGNCHIKVETELSAEERKSKGLLI